MKTFLDWAKENKVEVPIWTGEDGKTILERGLRTGIKWGYPDAYVRAHYPDAYPVPSSATAFLDKLQSSKQKDKAPSDEAP